jgi:alpha-galactosidase
MIIDDGWQLNRTYGKNSYIGGPWIANDRFGGDMSTTADAIHAKGAKAGIWFRPLLTRGEYPEEADYAFASGGNVLDPSHPYTLEKVERDTASIRSRGFDLIKHDFTTIDITGKAPLAACNASKELCAREKSFFDNTKTTATIIKNLYTAIQRGAGDADVIGCNTVSHLTAGIHTVYRVGNDTSGRSFEWTRRNGVNSVMRLPLNNVFYNVDPDCAAFTEKVDAELNLDFLEMCAITGMTALASVTPGILSDKQMERINSVFRLADEDKLRYKIANFDKNSNPDVFVSPDKKDVRKFDWISAYDGARSVLSWTD